MSGTPNSSTLGMGGLHIGNTTSWAPASPSAAPAAAASSSSAAAAGSSSEMNDQEAQNEYGESTEDADAGDAVEQLTDHDAEEHEVSQQKLYAKGAKMNAGDKQPPKARRTDIQSASAAAAAATTSAHSQQGEQLLPTRPPQQWSYFHARVRTHANTRKLSDLFAFSLYCYRVRVYVSRRRILQWIRCVVQV